MRRLRGSLAFAVALITAAGCGGGKSSPRGDGGAGDVITPVDSGGTGHDAPSGMDTGMPPVDSGGTDTATMDTSMPPPDTGTGPWDGGFSGPLTCSAPGKYATNWAGSCGVQRWDVKTGTDSAATSVSLLPTLTTISDLVSIPGKTPSGGRLGPTETTVWALQDVNLTFARLEDDSDYHLVLQDGMGNTLIAEVPYPGCVYGGPWGCFISRARASVEAQIGVSNLMLDMGHSQGLAASVIGVGFWDMEHGQFGASKNGVELHAVLAICFGVGCNPTLD